MLFVYVWTTRKRTPSLLAQKVPFIITCYLYQEEIDRTLLLTTTLLSDEVTNCLYPVCQQIKGELGEFSIMLRQMFSKIEDFWGDEYDLRRVNKLIMMLETGCPLTDNDKKKMCSFLLSATLDQNAVEYNASAISIFAQVCYKP